MNHSIENENVRASMYLKGGRASAHGRPPELVGQMSMLPTQPVVGSAEHNRELHMRILEECNALFYAKNKDYGNSAADTYRHWDTALRGKIPNGGILTIVIRLQDKLNRLASYVLNDNMEVKDEGVKDTLQDIINYSGIGLMELDNK